jgi:hypothetical protein
MFNEETMRRLAASRDAFSEVLHRIIAAKDVVDYIMDFVPTGTIPGRSGYFLQDIE